MAKLKLSRETLRILSPEEIPQMAGGSCDFTYSCECIPTPDTLCFSTCHACGPPPPTENVCPC